MKGGEIKSSQTLKSYGRTARSSPLLRPSRKSHSLVTGIPGDRDIILKTEPGGGGFWVQSPCLISCPPSSSQALTLQAGHWRILWRFESSKNRFLKIVTWGGIPSEHPPNPTSAGLRVCPNTPRGSCRLFENVYLGLWYISKIKKTNRASRYQVTQEFHPGKWKQMSTQNLYTNVHSSTTLNSQKVETTPAILSGWLDQLMVVCAYSGILFSHKKQWSTDVFCKMDEPWWHYAQWKKIDT